MGSAFGRFSYGARARYARMLMITEDMNSLFRGLPPPPARAVSCLPQSAEALRRGTPYSGPKSQKVHVTLHTRGPRRVIAHTR